MNNDVDVGSLIINSKEKLTPLGNLTYFFQLQTKGENYSNNRCCNSYYNTEFKHLNTLARSDQIKI